MSRPSTIAITGSNGRLGCEILQMNWDGYNVIPLTRKDADLSDLTETMQVLLHHQPHTILHLASGTDLARCQEDEEYAWTQVAVPCINIAKAALETGCRVVMMSTDYVYSGNLPGPLPPSTPPHPINVYGTMKLAGECAIRTLPDYAIIRGTFKENNGRVRPEAPSDMWCTYRTTHEMAAFLHDVVQERLSGILHAPGEDLSAIEFARSMDPTVQSVLRKDIDYPLPRDLRLSPGRWLATNTKED